MQKIKLDFTDPQFLSDPYPTYDQLRDCEPVYLSDEGVYYLSRYDDVVKLFSDKSTSRRPPHQQHQFSVQTLRDNDLDQFLSSWLIFQDPPKHTQMRNFFARVINAQKIRAKANTIEAITKQVINNVKQLSQFDVVNDLARPLSLAVVSELSGSPHEHIDFITYFSSLITAHLDIGDPEEAYKLNTVLPELRAFFQRCLFEVKKTSPNNWLSDIIMLNGSLEEPLNESQLIDSIVFLVFSGHETTRLSISLSIYRLLQQRDACAQLCDQPNLIPSAVEECLRLESPFNKLSRWLTQPMTFCDVTIPEDALVVGMINSANHDPDIFDNPNLLNWQRNNLNRHIAFGKGIHTCLGAVLGRLETEIALREVINELPKWQLTEHGIIWGNISALRYINRLIVKFA